ncbi:MAG: helix-turn-helix transcriptional regulator [Chloroflexi bacterium]|jgi:DNA-binding HxlR family transcriptional regulator|nr:MAG: helix-turn-helix transcriptional regulator [Chloroflexota bacterium]
MDELARALAVVGRKWALLIVEALREGPRRFTEIERSLGAANPKMVTARLRELEAAGVVSRTVYAEVPPRVEYELTDRGRELRPAIDALRRWGTRRRVR